MKLILNLLLLMSTTVFVKAQTANVLPVDEQGKLIYYEVVELKNTAKDSLQARVLAYLKNQRKDLKFKSAQGDSVFMATGKLIISKTLLVMSHPSGEILYQFEAAIKNGKYRFWLTDFKFIPYTRDRYGNFVAATTTGIPLEKDPGKLNAGEWKEYKLQTAKYASEFANNFKQYMASKVPLPIPVPEKKIISKNW